MDVKTIAFYNRPFPLGGAETVSRNLAYFLHAKGLRVIIYTSLLQDELLSDEDRRTFDVRVLPESVKEGTPKNVAFLRRSLTEERVDVLIVQCIALFPYEELFSTIETRMIFCLHSLPLWEVNDWRHRKLSQLWNPTFLRKMEFIFLRKPVYRLTDKLEKRYLKIYAGILPYIDRFVTLCPEYSNEMLGMLRGGGIDTKPAEAKFRSIANPLLPPAAPTVCPKEKIVLYVGRLSHCDKRVDRLLRIWKFVERRNPDWKLIVVGEGPEERSLRRLSRRLKLKHVEFAGYHADVAPFYRRASFVCLTSSFEGFGMSLVEGQQYGAIPVSFDSYAAVREITENGEAGVLVPPFSIRKYAERLSEALSDTALQERLRQHCYRAVKRYDLQAIGQQWLQLFEQL